MPSIADLQAQVRERSPFDREKTEGIVADHFATLQRRIAFALERWPELREQSVLDVGCSYGHCLAHFGPGSMGIDSNAEHVEFCEALGLTARVMDAQSPDALDGAQFDTVWVCDVLEHLVAPHEVLRDLRRFISPSGRLIVFLTLAPASPLVRAAMRRVDTGFQANAHHYQFTYDTAVFLVERAGYRIASAVPPVRLPKRVTTRIYLEAVPDEAAERIAANAELRNRGGVTRPSL